VEDEGFFGSHSMRLLFSAQAVSSLGDWIGLVAVLALASRLTRGTSFAIFGSGFVLMSRLVPGLFLAPAAGVLVDRLDRRKLMVACDIVRGVLVISLPFVTRLWVLLLISLCLEAAQDIWVPAKEASVPNMVSPKLLQRANSLSLAAAYGTMPIGAAIFGGLTKVAGILGGVSFLRSLEVNQESLALFLDGATFFTSGFLVSRLALPAVPSSRRVNQPGVIDTWVDLKSGVRFIARDPLVRTVMTGLGAAFVGAGAVVSLGATFVMTLLAGGAAGYGLILFSLGFGAAVGVLVANTAGRRLSPVLVFTGSCTLAGASLVLAASMTSLGPSTFFVGLLGFFAAPGYSGGFTLMHHHVSDDLRGRVFGALLTVIRVGMVISLGLSPIFAGFMDKLSRGLFPGAVVHLGAFSVNVAGVRVTLWLAGLLIGGSGIWAARRLWWKERAARRRGTGAVGPVAGELPHGVDPKDVASFDASSDSPGS
jgi:dTMP kinase